MDHYRRDGFSNITVVVIVLVLALVGVVVYVAVNKESAKRSAQQPLAQHQPSEPLSADQKGHEDIQNGEENIPGDVIDPKVYVNNDFRLSFSYPQRWYIGQSRLQYGDHLRIVDDLAALEEGYDGFANVITFGVEENSQGLSLSRWVNEHVGIDGRKSELTRIVESETMILYGVNEMFGEQTIEAVIARGDEIFIFSADGNMSVMVVQQNILPSLNFF